MSRLDACSRYSTLFCLIQAHNMINVGLLGLSSFAVTKMIPALADSPHLNLYGVASRSRDKANFFSAQHKCLAYDCYSDLISCPSIDLIYIPLPNSFHFHWAFQALTESKHVLLEKPLTLSHSESQILIDLALDNNRVISENFLFPYHTQSKWFFDILDGRYTGSVNNIYSSFFIPARSTSDIRYQLSLGGGALNDLGCYMTKLAHYMFGPSIELVESYIVTSAKYNIDISGSAVYRSNSKLLRVQWGFDSCYECSLAVEGSRSTISSKRFFTMPPEHSPIIFKDNKKFTLLKCDNQYLNKWHSLVDFIEKRICINTHFLDLLSQSQSLVEIRKNSQYSST